MVMQATKNINNRLNQCICWPYKKIHYTIIKQIIMYYNKNQTVDSLGTVA